MYDAHKSDYSDSVGFVYVFNTKSHRMCNSRTMLIQIKQFETVTIWMTKKSSSVLLWIYV